MSQTVRSLSITEAEETVLVEMIQYFNDLGWINDTNVDEYDSLCEKICEPAFWEYNQMGQFQDPTDYTFRTPDGNETTFSAYDLDTALCQAPPNSELIRVNDDPRFQGTTCAN